MKAITIPDIIKMLGEMSDRFAKNPELLVESGEILGLAELLSQAYDKLKWAEAVNKMINERVGAILKITKEKNEKGERDIPPTPPIEREGKEEEKEPTYSACARARLVAMREKVRQENKEADKVFDAFWTRYPTGRKHDKKKCNECFRRIYHNAKDKAHFINAFFGGLDRWIESQQWVDGFICAPLVFLHQSRWLDNPEPARASAQDNQEAEAKKRSDDLAARLKEIGV